jgi:hypothetical protein
MPNAGRAFRHHVHGVIGLEALLGLGRDLLVDQRLDLMGLGLADDDQPEIVADEGRQLGIGEDAGKVRNQRGFMRALDMLLDLGAALAAQFAHQRIEDAENIEVVFLLGHGVAQGLGRRGAGIGHRLHRVGDDVGADRRSQDDHQFPGLPEHGDMPAHGGKSRRSANPLLSQSDQVRSTRRSFSQVYEREIETSWLARG